MNNPLRIVLVAGLLSGAVAAQAQEAITANVALTTDYLYRGISQTSGGPAIQGGFDYAHESGFYVGTWASSITFDDAIEIDYYGGFAGSLTEAVEFDVGVLYYDYPGAPDDDFVELYGGLTFAGITAKAAWSDDFFAGSGESVYYTLDYGFDLTEGLSLGLHYGLNTFDELTWGSEDSYSDYSVSLGGALAGLDLSLTWTDTSLSTAECGGTDDCDSTVSFAVGKSF